MSNEKAGAAARPTLSVRPTDDRKSKTSQGEQPAKVARATNVGDDKTHAAAGSAVIAKEPTAPQHAPVALASADPAAWSHEDEATLNALLARRKAAGFQRRGRDVSGQQLRCGQVQPNPGTVAATIVGLLGERDAVTRAELLDLMAVATFTHPKAQPQDQAWCQGYVAGLLRSGFLVASERPASNGSQMHDSRN